MATLSIDVKDDHQKNASLGLEDLGIMFDALREREEILCGALFQIEEVIAKISGKPFDKPAATAFLERDLRQRAARIISEIIEETLEACEKNSHSEGLERRDLLK